MKKFKISTVTAITVYAMLAVVLSSCSQKISNHDEDPKQVVYVGKGMIVFSKELGNEHYQPCTMLTSSVLKRIYAL